MYTTKYTKTYHIYGDEHVVNYLNPFGLNFEQEQYGRREYLQNYGSYPTKLTLDDVLAIAQMKKNNSHFRILFNYDFNHLAIFVYYDMTYICDYYYEDDSEDAVCNIVYKLIYLGILPLDVDYGFCFDDWFGDEADEIEAMFNMTKKLTCYDDCYL